VTAAVIVKKKVHMSMCFTEWLSKERCLNLQTKLHYISFAELNEKRRLENKGGWARRIARSRFGCRCSHKETWR